MIGKSLFCLSLLVGSFLGLCANAVTTSKNIDIIVTHSGSDPGCNISGPHVSSDNYAPNAGDTVHITACGGPGNLRDYVVIRTYSPPHGLDQLFYLNGATSGTFALTIPDVKSDRPIRYQAVFECCDSFSAIAIDPNLMTVPATVVSPPTQNLPSALAADPFVPSHTV